MNIDLKKVERIDFADNGAHVIRFRATNKDIEAENAAFESLNDAIQNDAPDSEYERRRAVYAAVLRNRGTLDEEHERTRKL